MDWIKRYRQASFRGVPFFVPAHEGTGGRRGVVHEFPGKDIPYLEDLGRGARAFMLDAYVLGDDYFIQRNALLDAVEKAGTGKLIHPYFGEFKVQCLNYSIRESVQEGRMARFSLTFAEAGALTFPKVEIATTENVSLKKLSAFDKMRQAFKKAYNIAKIPYSQTQNVLNTINKGLILIGDVKKVVGAVSSFEHDLLNIKGSVIAIAYDGLELAENLIDIINFGTELGLADFDLTPGRARDQYSELVKLFDYEPEFIINADDPSLLVSGLIQQAAAVSIASLLSVIDFESLDEAQEFSRVVYDKLQTLAELGMDDDIFASFQDLRSAIHRDLESRIVSLPRLITYTPYETTNSLALAYYLYGTVEKETEIINRNKLTHPGFILGSRPLEVLLNV